MKSLLQVAIDKSSKGPPPGKGKGERSNRIFWGQLRSRKDSNKYHTHAQNSNAEDFNDNDHAIFHDSLKIFSKNVRLHSASRLNFFLTELKGIE